jgi:acylphosphatase
MDVYKFNIKGKVQGVFYRKSIQQIASIGQIPGYIRNLKDGSVEVVAALHEDQLNDFLTILNNGSPLSNVEKIEYKIVEDDDDIIYDGFEIRY